MRHPHRSLSNKRDFPANLDKVASDRWEAVEGKGSKKVITSKILVSGHGLHATTTWLPGPSREETPRGSRGRKLRVEPAVSWRPSRLAVIAEFELDAAQDGSSSAADRLGVPLIGGNAIKQPGADGDPMINAESSWS